MPDTEGPREFMREKIVKQPLTKTEIARRLAVFFCLAFFFGGVSAVSFVLTKPFAEHYFGKEQEEDPVSFSKDEPETLANESVLPSAGAEETIGNLDEAVEKALRDYYPSKEMITSVYAVLHETAQTADKGIVTVSSGKQQMDLFGNPVESTGDYAGAVIASTKEEYLIFTSAEAVSQADSISVTFSDGSQAAGQAKQTDGVSGMAVVAVRAEELDKELKEQIHVLPLGNSYSVKTGDPVIGVGSPVGMLHSVTYGTVSYIARDIRLTDGISRVIYADLNSDARMGTFLLNFDGELIGWASGEFLPERSGMITTAVSISDYKNILERMTNGQQSPYFGVKGQEVNESMAESGIPKGVYVVETAASSPAYNAGIQNGDIITLFGDKKTETFKELKMQIEAVKCGTSVPVKIMRKGRNGYTELEYQVEVRAR